VPAQNRHEVRAMTWIGLAAGRPEHDPEDEQGYDAGAKDKSEGPEEVSHARHPSSLPSAAGVSVQAYTNRPLL